MNAEGKAKKRKRKQRRSDGGILTRRDAQGNEVHRLRYGVPAAPGEKIAKWHYFSMRGTLQEAKAELAKRLAQLREGAHVDPQRLTVADWIATWTEHYAKPSVSAKTFERYAELLACTSRPTSGNAAFRSSPARISRRFTRRCARAESCGRMALPLTKGSRSRPSSTYIGCSISASVKRPASASLRAIPSRL
jgi:hypothetical protein